MTSRTFLIYAFSILSLLRLSGQSSPEITPLVFSGISTDEAIILRWAPSNSMLLEHGKKYGYTLTKSWNDGQSDRYERIVLKAKTIEEWDAFKSDEYGYKATREIIRNKPKTDLQDYSPTERFTIQRTSFYMELLMSDISKEASSYNGLGFIDYEITDNTNYSYTLKINNVDSIQNKLYFEINTKEKNVFPNITDLNGHTKDKVGFIDWDYNINAKYYAAYNIEKSSDGGLSYKQLNTAPFVPMTSTSSLGRADIISYQDSLKEYNVSYLYRIQGISFFGTKGPLSNTIEITCPPPPIPAKPAITDVFENKEGEMKTVWHFNKNFEKQVKHFKVYRSIDQKRTFSLISREIDPSERSFIDVNPMQINFYKVIAVDENGNNLESLANLGQLNDTTPPHKPKGLLGEIDSLGIVNLEWENNVDSDLKGYYVFYSNVIDGEYSILTNKSILYANNFTDSISITTLAEFIYYKVMALDFRGNQSLFSEPLVLKRPDNNPPTKAIFKERENRLNEIFFSFTLSGSSDLSKSILQRKTSNEEWIEIFQTSKIGISLEYQDSLISTNKVYQYRVISQDKNGLESISKTLTMKAIAGENGTTFQDLFVVLTEDSKVRVSWKYNLSSPLKSIIIYRAANEDPITKYKQFWKSDIVNLDSQDWIDKAVSIGDSYSYQILLRFQDNSFSRSKITSSIKVK